MENGGVNKVLTVSNIFKNGDYDAGYDISFSLSEIRNPINSKTSDTFTAEAFYNSSGG